MSINENTRNLHVHVQVLLSGQGRLNFFPHRCFIPSLPTYPYLPCTLLPHSLTPHYLRSVNERQKEGSSQKSKRKKSIMEEPLRFSLLLSLEVVFVAYTLSSYLQVSFSRFCFYFCFQVGTAVSISYHTIPVHTIPYHNIILQRSNNNIRIPFS